jgi:hypothetical protein
VGGPFLGRRDGVANSLNNRPNDIIGIHNKFLKFGSVGEISVDLVNELRCFVCGFLNLFGRGFESGFDAIKRSVKSNFDGFAGLASEFFNLIGEAKVAEHIINGRSGVDWAMGEIKANIVDEAFKFEFVKLKGAGASIGIKGMGSTSMIIKNDSR